MLSISTVWFINNFTEFLTWIFLVYIVCGCFVTSSHYQKSPLSLSITGPCYFSPLQSSVSLFFILSSLLTCFSRVEVNQTHLTLVPNCLMGSQLTLLTLCWLAWDPAEAEPALLVLICHWTLLVGSGCGCCCCSCCWSWIWVTDCCWGLDKWPDWTLTLPDIIPGLGLLSGELVREETWRLIN